MDKNRGLIKQSKKRAKRSSKKSKHYRRSPCLKEHDYKYKMRSTKETQQSNKIVEYSDVSSEDFSAPEAGEIQDEENLLLLNDRECTNKNNIGNKSGRIGASKPTSAIMEDIEHSSKVTLTQSQRKIIVGSPISSSISSNSRSKLQHSLSPTEFLGKESISSSFNEDNDDDENDDDNDIKSDDSELERKRKKSKKAKKKKSKKKRKKRRNKSISSIENISDNDSVLDDEIDNLTASGRTASPTHWNKRYTPSRVNSLSKSPTTPPLRPNSNMSIYSDTSRRTPPLAQKFIMSSPHTPPLSRKSTSTLYHSSPTEIDLNSSLSHSHSHSQFQQSSYHSYHHQPRSPILISNKDKESSSSQRSKSPRMYLMKYIYIVSLSKFICVIFYKTTVIKTFFSVSNRRNISSYSPPSHCSKRRRGGTDRPYDRSSDYHYSSKRNSDGQNHRHSRERASETYDLTTPSSSSSNRLLSSNRKRRALQSPSPVRTHSSKRHSRSHSPRAFRSAVSPAFYSSSRSNRGDSTTPPSRKIDISNKIPDTSLFAELVKDKHKRDKVLKEIIDKQEEKVVLPNTGNPHSVIINNNDIITSSNLVVIDSVDGTSAGENSKSVTSNDAQASNGIKNTLRMNLVDIPMPNADDNQNSCNTDTTSTNTISNIISIQPPPPPPKTIQEMNTGNNSIIKCIE